MKRKKLTVDSVFNKFEDEDSDDMPRKRKLVPLDYGDEDKSSSKGSVNTEEKRKHIKSLIEKIPTAKPELFAYPLDWSIVDSVSILTNIPLPIHIIFKELITTVCLLSFGPVSLKHLMSPRKAILCFLNTGYKMRSPL